MLLMISRALVDSGKVWRSLGLAVLASLAVLRADLSAHTLTTGTLKGTVRNQSGLGIPRAKVTVSDASLTQTVYASDRGEYLFPTLPPGKYEVIAEFPGFAMQTREVLLELNQFAKADFELSAVASEMVDVKAPPAEYVEGPAGSTVIDQNLVKTLPVIDRKFTEIAKIIPGVSTDRVPGTGTALTSGISFLGQRGRSNNIMIDGLDNNDQETGGVRAPFSQEAVREFEVLTNSYSAEFGNASGGIVNTVTKSGSNELHGNAFLYFRDDSLNAKEYFERFDVFGNPISREKAPYSQSQYGATLGGPLKKDKTFYFLSMERSDIRASNFVTIDPTVAALLNDEGFPVAVGAVPYDVKALQLLARLDHRWSDSSSLFVRAHHTNTTNQNIEPFGGIVARSRAAEQRATDYSLAASQTNTFATAQPWINEVRVLFDRFDNTLAALDPTCDGPCDGYLEGGPAVDIVGVASVGRLRFTPWPRLTHRIQLIETLGHFDGPHQWKAGMDLSYAHLKQAFPLHLGGRYVFAALPAIPGVTSTPLSAVQAFERGLPATYVQGYGEPSGSYGFGDLSVFAQDEWQVGRRLRVLPGIRYQKRFWPDVAYDVSDVNGGHFRYAFPEDNNNFAPRIAANFDPKGDGQISIKLAYGIYFDSLIRVITSITGVVDGGPDGVRTRALGLPGAMEGWQAPGHRLPEPATPYPSVQFAVGPGLQDPLVHEFHFGVSRTWGTDFNVSGDLVYVRGKGQLGALDYNPVVPSLGARRRPNDLGGRPGTSSSVLQYTGFDESSYRGLMLSVRRVRNDYELLANYTLSRARDRSTDFQGAFIPQDVGRGRNPADPGGLPLGFDPDTETGPSIQDQRHRFVFSGVRRLPYSIELSTIVTVASGRPYTPLAGFDWNGNGDGGAFPADRARRTPGPIPSEPTDSVGRNSETTEKQVTVDARLSKRFAMGRVTLEALVEAFNLLNRVNFSDINNVFGAGSFPDEPQTDAQGRVTYGLYQGALPARQVQLALKVAF